MITAKLLEIDRPTSTGRIYPQKLVESALADWQKHFNMKTMPIFKEAAATPQVTDILGYAENFRFEDGFLVADIGFLEGRMDEVGKDGETITVRPNGSGTADPETGVIREGYKIVGLCIRRKPLN
jgi:hypothetical protein